jgi:hypothetical protein
MKGLIPLQFFLCLQYTNFIASYVIDPRFTPQGGVSEFCGNVAFLSNWRPMLKQNFELLLSGYILQVCCKH